MWYLVFILVVPVSGFQRVTVLDTYETAALCAEQAVRVQEAMTDAYPDDQTFRIACLTKKPLVHTSS